MSCQICGRPAEGGIVGFDEATCRDCLEWSAKRHVTISESRRQRGAIGEEYWRAKDWKKVGSAMPAP